MKTTDELGPLPPNNSVTLSQLVSEWRNEALQWDLGFPGTVRWLLQRPALAIRSFVWTP